MHRYTHVTKIHKTLIKNVIVILILPQALKFIFLKKTVQIRGWQENNQSSKIWHNSIVFSISSSWGLWGVGG